jgi:hypothetical protein
MSGLQTQTPIQSQTETSEIITKPIDEETLRSLVKDILKEPDKYPTEAKLILAVKREGRRPGCGYRYLYKNDYKILEGEVQEVVLKYGEHDCNWFEDVAIIPTTVPVILVEYYHDDNPEVSDYINVHIFGSDGWRSVKVYVPK